MRFESIDGSANVVAYLHFHRSSMTMPADRTYELGNSVHAHYYSGDWERILALLNHSGTLKARWQSYNQNFYLTRTTTPN